MGMFDYAYIEIPLPEGFEQYQDDQYQTKDLINAMDTYIVRADGTLWERHYGHRHLTEEEIAEWKAKYPEGHMFHEFYPIFKPDGTYEDTKVDDVHQDVEFHNRYTDVFVHVIIRFTNGMVQSVTAQRYEKGEWKNPAQTASYNFVPTVQQIET